MRLLKFSALFLTLVLTQVVHAQFSSNDRPAKDPKKAANADPSDPPAPSPVPPLKDVYGDLINDDPVYNRRSDWPVALYKVLGQNIELWAIDRYIFNYDFSHIGFNSWRNNLERGFAWEDFDRFGIDF